MTKTEKEEKLKKLDELVLDKMIEIMEGEGDIDDLSSLSTPMNYLRNNQTLAEKPKSTVEEDTKARLKRARERRAKGESK